MDIDSATTNPDPLEAFKKIDRLWYDDADVVFCAGKSKFRVHRGILSAQSTIFRDMFSLPQGAGKAGTTTNEAFAVITLPDDEKDLYYFFLAIFDASFYVPSDWTVFPLVVTLSILRLAHKYEVPFLMLRATIHLDSLFPHWERRTRPSLALTSSGHFNEPNEGEGVSIKRGIHSFLFGIGRERDEMYLSKLLSGYLDMLPILDQLGLQWLIPSVLYFVTYRKIGKVMENPSFGRLGSKYQILVVQYEIIHAMEEDSKNSWVGIIPSANCLSQTICAEISRTIQANDIDLPLRQKCHFRLGGRSLCSNCDAEREKHVVKLDKKFLNQYGMLGGFESWEDVMKVRCRALSDLKDRVAEFSSVKVFKCG